MKRCNDFIKEIKTTESEYDVQRIYTKELNYYYPDVKINRDYSCDGLIEKGELKLIIELKYNKNFSDKSAQCKVIIQSLYYIKKFKDNGLKPPNVILIGDEDEVFVINNDIINKYIDENIDWSIAPSKAGLKNPQLILKMIKDDEITPYIFNIDDNFKFSQVVDHINDLVRDLKSYVPITESNISWIYDHFIINVIKDYKKYNTNELVSIFITLMTNPQNNYLHPQKKNYLVLQNNREIQINRDRFISFFKHFQKEYTPKEKEKFTEIADRLIEDTNRRAKGEFYTSTKWSDEAHIMISRALGVDWKEKYIVWDCAWGTGNLTRDYDFKELYCSTLYESDISIGSRYNKCAIKFQYDFLNDDTELLEGLHLLNDTFKLHNDLLLAFKTNKPIVFFINPPYGSAGNMKTDGSNKKGIVDTKINKIMKQYPMGACSQQLYAQFLFRILLMKKLYSLDNIRICLFSSPLFLTGSSFKNFREIFLKEFSYEAGMLFQANNFDDVSDTWGISFSIWKNGETTDKYGFEHNIKKVELRNKSIDIITADIKKIYNIDNKRSFSDWIKEDVKALKTYDSPQLTSALKVKNSGYGRLIKDALGYYVNSGNSVYDNNSDVFLLSGCSSRGHGTSVMPSNFLRVTANFTARKLLTGKNSTWINNKDEYLVPNTTHPKYIEWCNDAVIYSLFNTSSNQSSLRGISYKNKTYNIQNEFFFMSNSKIQELANAYSNDEIYLDTKNFNCDRYVYKYINQIQLSHEANLLLNKAKSLVEKSFQYRTILSEDYPEYHLNTWDAGWYQIKIILKMYFKNDLDDFYGLYKVLEQKLRLMIYDLEILQ